MCRLRCSSLWRSYQEPHPERCQPLGVDVTPRTLPKVPATLGTCFTPHLTRVVISRTRAATRQPLLLDVSVLTARLHRSTFLEPPPAPIAHVQPLRECHLA